MNYSNVTNKETQTQGVKYLTKAGFKSVQLRFRFRCISTKLYDLSCFRRSETTKMSMANILWNIWNQVQVLCF